MNSMFITQQPAASVFIRRVMEWIIVVGVLMQANFAWSAVPPDAPVVADFSPFVTVGTRYDDNLFRKSSDELIGIEGEEFVTRAGGGLRLDLPVSRQRFQAMIMAERAHYAAYQMLNHNAADGEGSWDWEVGDWITGGVNGRYKRSLSSFEESDEVIKDMQTERAVDVTLGLRVLGPFQFVANGGSKAVEKSIRVFLNRREDHAGGELRWRWSDFTYVGVRQRMVRSDYIQPIALRNSDFDLTASELVWSWESETKSKFTGAVGRSKKNFEDSNFPDFNGSTFEATMWWRTTARVTIEGLVRRMLRTRDDASGDSVQRLERIRPVWEATERLSFTCSWTRERDEFPQTPQPPDITARSDKTQRLSAGVRYAPLEALSLEFNIGHEMRDSSIEANDFTADSYLFSAEYQF